MVAEIEKPGQPEEATMEDRYGEAMSETPRETAQAWCEKHAEHKSVPGTTFVSGRLLCSRDDVVQLLQPLVAERDALRAEMSKPGAAWGVAERLGKRAEAAEDQRDALLCAANGLKQCCDEQRAEVERRKALAESTQLECNLLAATVHDLGVQLEESGKEERALRAEVERLRAGGGG